MNYSLVDHNRNYQITSRDVLFSIATGLSGAPYALRHYQLAKVENAPKWGHRLICLAQLVPVLGLLVALVERVIYALFCSGYSDVPWRTAPLSIESAFDEMKEKVLSATAQHYITSGVYASVEKAMKNLSALQMRAEENPLQCTHQTAEAQGPRPQMEDAHFYKDMGKGILAGVFDGHGGKEVSAFASQEFQKRFPKALEEAKGNVHTAFERVIHHIHQDIARNSSWNQIGSTAVVCYIDKETRAVYTATLGDSEANIYRNSLLGRVTSIPLSLVRDWKNERNRLINVFGLRNVVTWMSLVENNAKYIRSRLYNGVNVSRAFGDVDETGTPASPLVIHQPEITVQKLQSGDHLVLACDGLKDFVSERETTNIVSKVQSVRNKVLGGTKSLAEELVQAALNNMTRKKGDNVTVMTIHVA